MVEGAIRREWFRAMPGRAFGQAGSGQAGPAGAGPPCAQFTNVPMTRAMLCAISLSSGNDSMPITEYPRSHGIR